MIYGMILLEIYLTMRCKDGQEKDISMAVIKRLPKYYRHLAELLRNDVDRVSSKN